MENSIIQAIAASAGIEKLHEAPNWPYHPLGGLMSYKRNTPYFQLDDEGVLIGLNLAFTELTNERWQAVLAVPGFSLEYLRGLNLSGNKLTIFHLPESMQALEQLELSQNEQLTEFSFPAKGMAALDRADVNYGAFESLVVPANMPKLQTLNLRFGKLSSLKFEGDLSVLEVLDVRDNQLNLLQLPKGFGKLRYLNLDRNQLARVEFASELPALLSLYLKKNQLSLINFHRGLPSVDCMYLQDNQIDEIPDDLLERMPALEVLYLSGNPLERANKELLGTDGNVFKDLVNILASMVKGVAQNNEVKMVLVGNSTVGKTSLDRYLREGVFETGENTTHGIRVHRWEPLKDNGDKTGLNVFIWDFGGQEYYHATHRLFLSNNAVYCLLWNKPTNLQGTVPTELYHNGEKLELNLEHYPYDYWLKNIRTYAKEGPVMLVQSREGAQEAVPPEIFDTYNIEPKQNFHVCIKRVAEQDQLKIDGFRQFRNQLLEHLQNQAARFSIGRYWVQIRDAIREEAEKVSEDKYPRWSWKEYLGFCQGIDKSMSESEAETLVRYLKEIGVVLYYPDVEDLKNVVFYKPTWVTDRIYDVFNEQVKTNQGKFNFQHIENVLPTKGLENANQLAKELLTLMNEFRLIFSRENNPDTYYAIQYLSDTFSTEATYNRSKKVTPHLAFVLHFPVFLPKAIFHQFIANYGRTANDEFWKYGLFFIHEDPGMDVLAECKFEDQRIEIWLQEPNARVAHELYQAFVKLNEGNNRFEISTNGEDFVSEERVLEALELGNSKIKTTNNKQSESQTFFTLLTGNNYNESESIINEQTTNHSMETIRELIAQNRLKEAIVLLKSQLPVEHQDTLLIIESRLRKLNSDEMKGILYSSEADVQRNMIVKDLLNLTSQNLLQSPMQANIHETPAVNKILFLSANPSNQRRIATGKEFRKIKNQLNLGRSREHFEFQMPEISVTVIALLQAMNEEPYVVHFSGHGSQEGIYIEREDGTAQIMPIPALKRLFKNRSNIKIVLLMSCYSAEQAKIISEFGLVVVGNSQPISDEGAISFSTGFYNGLGEGKNFEHAFNDAMTVVETESPADAGIIEVWKDGQKMDL